MSLYFVFAFLGLVLVARFIFGTEIGEWQGFGILLIVIGIVLFAIFEPLKSDNDKENAQQSSKEGGKKTLLEEEPINVHLLQVDKDLGFSIGAKRKRPHYYNPRY